MATIVQGRAVATSLGLNMPEIMDQFMAGPDMPDHAGSTTAFAADMNKDMS